MYKYEFQAELLHSKLYMLSFNNDVIFYTARNSNANSKYFDLSCLGWLHGNKLFDWLPGDKLFDWLPGSKFFLSIT